VRIETGMHHGDLVEVRHGIAAADRIVVRGQAALIDGSVVSLRNEDGSPVAPGALDVAAGATDG
jgi:hypothetical protein